MVEGLRQGSSALYNCVVSAQVKSHRTLSATYDKRPNCRAKMRDSQPCLGEEFERIYRLAIYFDGKMKMYTGRVTAAAAVISATHIADQRAYIHRLTC